MSSDVSSGVIRGGSVTVKLSDVYEKRVYAVRCPLCPYVAEGDTPARAIDALRRHLKLKHRVEVVVE
jgi:hypothetical protein